jgi:hypothetical protein
MAIGILEISPSHWTLLPLGEYCVFLQLYIPMSSTSGETIVYVTTFFRRWIYPAHTTYSLKDHDPLLTYATRLHRLPPKSLTL